MVDIYVLCSRLMNGYLSAVYILLHLFILFCYIFFTKEVALRMCEYELNLHPLVFPFKFEHTTLLLVVTPPVGPVGDRAQDCDCSIENSEERHRQ